MDIVTFIAIARAISNRAPIAFDVRRQLYDEISLLLRTVKLSIEESPNEAIAQAEGPLWPKRDISKLCSCKLKCVLGALTLMRYTPQQNRDELDERDRGQEERGEWQSGLPMASV